MAGQPERMMILMTRGNDKHDNIVVTRGSD
eukprot:COSAG06_NODE_55158_length_291_cov_0.541667_1_plen_29_part_10